MTNLIVFLLEFISYLITLYIYIVIADVILSWLMAFGVVNPYNPTRALHLAGAQRRDRAAAAPDPQRAARPRRHRYLAARAAARSASSCSGLISPSLIAELSSTVG